MWRREVSAIYSGVTLDEVWSAWSDVNNWHQWDSEIEYCDSRQPFVAGSRFVLKPQQGPKVKIKLKTVDSHRSFTSCCYFIGAKMYHEHLLQQVEGGVKITQVIRLTGPLAVLWVSLVADKLVNQLPQQTQNLVNYVSSVYA